MDLEGVYGLYGRRFEVVADGLTLWHGAQFAIDTTLVSPLHRDGGQRQTRTEWHCNKPDPPRRPTTCPDLSAKGRKGTFGGARFRSRGAMVPGDGIILARFGQSKRPDNSPDPPEPRQGGMVPQMEQRDGTRPGLSRGPSWTSQQIQGQVQTHPLVRTTGLFGWSLSRQMTFSDVSSFFPFKQKNRRGHH